MFDVKNRLWNHWLAMFGWQAAQQAEWWPVDLTNIRCPGDIAHPLQHQSASGTKTGPPKKPNLGLFADVFPSKVSHLFHTQTLSNWIVNLWWRLIIRPASEVLMRSYFSGITSPQTTSGNSRLWVLTCFGAFFIQFEEELNCHLFVEENGKGPYSKSVLLSLFGPSHPLASHSSSKWQTLS